MMGASPLACIVEDLVACGVEAVFLGGVIFQPYIELERGWDPARLREATYQDTCRLQAEVALEAAIRLADQGLIRRDR